MHGLDEELRSEVLPLDLAQVVEGMDVDEALVRRYCLGPRASHELSATAIDSTPAPRQPLRRSIATEVIDLEALFS